MRRCAVVPMLFVAALVVAPALVAPANAQEAVNNATKHAEATRITITLSEADSGVSVVVADNGVGIPDDVHHRVFENFFSTKGTEGTGLGLLVVQKVVSEHNGDISFASEEGKGTTFRIVLPNQRLARGHTPTISVESTGKLLA